ncbi:hypothetical protein JGH11_10805 [Dysgonomonas sp. Marseille-P4677]|uniref:hypothetical protein n=1 Tax=Dysgonomonas sp. Marseille-P4677 TaxID=2364790 RepID=UPI001911E8F7|nr:hypothetical protein [Dysgonomonas sp. Marseille-P4677]MBK5721362.1 hypothetical protein [Dysgonomonas sp. Marseille-P4677]
MKVLNYKKFAHSDYENTGDNYHMLGEVVFKTNELKDGNNPIGVIIQIHGYDEYRTDMYGNTNDGEIRIATIEEIEQYRPDLLSDIVTNIEIAKDIQSITLKSCYGETIVCSVKEIVKYESGRVRYIMDNKKCNDFHNSLFVVETMDCRVRSIDIFMSGNYHVFASYKNFRGNYKQGAWAFDADILKIR